MIEENNKPAVSVIIPTYNRAHLLGRAIQSVLNQTYHNFEIIVVDDGSQDNTEEVVNGFHDERVRYIRHMENRGGAAARNTGIRAAKGKYLAFQDSDDEWLPEKLEKQMKVFEDVSPEVGVVYTAFWRIEGDKKIYLPFPETSPKEGDIHETVLERNIVTTQAAVVRMECFSVAGLFDEELPRLQDWELWIRISKYYHFKFIDLPLVIAYYHPASISADQDALTKAAKIVLEKHFADFKKSPKALSMHYRRIGSSLCSSGEMAQGRKYFLKALKTCPPDITLIVELLLCFLISFCGQNAYQKAKKSYERNIHQRLRD